jgi:long-chain fatty acid transport protein
MQNVAPKHCLAGLAALMACPAPVMAGGFEIREQSTFFSGTAYAGAAAGGSSLSSVFWNPATSAFAGQGITTDSNYTLVLPRAELHADNATLFGFPVGGDMDVDIGRDALIPASYYAWRHDSRTVFALSINAPFGLTTKPDNMAWAGAHLAQTSKVTSINMTPSVSYQVTPQIAVGAGLQLQYTDIKHLNTALYQAEADDFGVGATAGINITPFRGTSVGLGYRSRISHEFEGKFNPGIPFPLDASFDLPDKVTVSLRQELTAATRLLASVEWTNWSVLQKVPVFVGGAPLGEILFNWEDGWSYSLGGEYDVTPRLTLRAGVNYEESPIQDATSRLIQLPDSDRIWFGLGASYKWSEMTTLNVSYLHVELEEARFERVGLQGPLSGTISGRSDVSADAISVGLTMRADSISDFFTFK